MTTLMAHRPGYNATIGADGVMVVHRVPIFVECERRDMHFDADWIRAAVEKAKLADAEGYLPPLHVRHHSKDAEENRAIRPAGFFKVLGTEKITFKGETRLAIIADLYVTDTGVQADIMNKRLPYRSVEIFNVDKPAIDSLALLDHEAPFLQLPMLMVTGIARQGAPAVAGATFRQDWALLAGPSPDSVVASFQRGRHAHLLFREEPMDDDEPKPKPKPEDGQPPTKGEQGNETVAGESGGKPEGMTGEKPAGESGDKPEATSPDVGAIVEAIRSGSITLADMAAILAAVQEVQGASAPQETAPEDDPAMKAPATAASPGSPRESMAAKNQPEPETTMKQELNPMSETMAALKGENEALSARVSAMEADAKRGKQVAAALKKLEGRPLGADLEGRLFAFHAEHGEKAFNAYVDSMEKTIGVPPKAGEGTEAELARQGRRVPEVAMKYQAEGVGAVDRAAKFAQEWEILHGANHTRMSQERYVAINMAKVTA